MSPEHSKPSIAIFGGEYNAKGRPLAEVARSFVPPAPTFTKLIQADNTLLIGPRGSGKTTLMKMLQGPALELLEHPNADDVRRSVNYSGVLVPGDQSWAKQLEALQMDIEDGTRFAVAVFTLHCLRALTRTAAERARKAAGSVSHGRVQLETPVGQRIARDVARVWQLGHPVLDLDDLATALTDAISRLTQLRSAVAYLPDRHRRERTSAEPLLHLDLIPAALPLVERFNRACNEPERRWAFLFDEAELVPRVINELIFSLLRGTDERFLFKVSYAPYENLGIELGKPHGPSEANDFTTLRLTFANKREAFPFTDALFRARLASANIAGEPDDVLGTTSVLALESDDEDSDDVPNDAAAYAPEAPYGRLLAELADIDDSFAKWLTTNRLDLAHAHDLPEDRRARLRKVLPVVALRVAWRRDPKRAEEGRVAQEIRGRRNVTLYSGKEAFYAMMEANPRWLYHVCDRLLPDAKRGKIGDERQSHQLGEVAAEFESYLRILPVRGTHMQVDDGPKVLLKRIATFFRDNYVRGTFNSDPYGSFWVDDKLSDTIVNSLRALINRGAVIEVPSKDGGGLHGLRGKRFRPAYIIAPKYGLPLRLDNSVALTRILQARPGGQLSISKDQMSLGED